MLFLREVLVLNLPKTKLKKYCFLLNFQNYYIASEAVTKNDRVISVKEA